MMTLTEIANAVGCDKGTMAHEAHGYTEVYETMIVRGSRMLEIGIDSGLSIRMWKEWDSSMRLVAVDNRIECLTQENIELSDARCCDQSDENQLRVLSAYLGTESLDVIIDDGSHRPDDQLLSIAVLFDCLKPGGVYFVEDLHTSNWFPQSVRAPGRLRTFARSVGAGIQFVCNGKLAVITKA